MGASGKRRGRYARRKAPVLVAIGAPPPEPEVITPQVSPEPSIPVWDQAHYDRLLAQSPLEDDAKRDPARHATMLHCRIVEMDRRLLGVEEQTNLRGFEGAYRKLLELLKIGTGKKKGGRERLLGKPEAAEVDSD